jgi:hypothetical protein
MFLDQECSVAVIVVEDSPVVETGGLAPFQAALIIVDGVTLTVKASKEIQTLMQMFSA